MESNCRIIIFIFTLFASIVSTYAQSPPEKLLQEMVQQLQATPDDNALREKIIRLGAEIKPVPAIPEEARRAFVRGNAAMSEAKTPEEYARAVQLYTDALVIAPWWGDPYFNLGKAQELRQEYESAIFALQRYLLTGTAGNDARQVQDHIYVLEEKRDQKAKVDEAIKSEQAQIVQRQVWAQDLVRWMTDNYGNLLLTKVQLCFYCTEEDSRGSNWTYAEAVLSPDFSNLSRDWSRLGKKLSFRTAGNNNEEIIFTGVAHNGVMVTDICGTVNGPRQEDITWKQCNSETIGWNGTPASAVFTTNTEGKPMVMIKSNCQADGHCSHANLMFD